MARTRYVLLLAVVGASVSISLLVLGCAGAGTDHGLMLRTASVSVTTHLQLPGQAGPAVVSVRQDDGDGASLSQLLKQAEALFPESEPPPVPIPGDLQEGLLLRTQEAQEGGFSAITDPIANQAQIEDELVDDSGNELQVSVGNDTWGDYYRFNADLWDSPDDVPEGVTAFTEYDKPRWAFLEPEIPDIALIQGHGYILYVRNGSSKPMYNVTGRITSATALWPDGETTIQAWLVSEEGEGWPSGWSPGDSELHPPDYAEHLLGGGDPGDWPLKFWEYGQTPVGELPATKGQPGCALLQDDEQNWYHDNTPADPEDLEGDPYYCAVQNRQNTSNGEYYTEAVIAMEWPWPPAVVGPDEVNFTLEVAWWEEAE